MTGQTRKEFFLTLLAPLAALFGIKLFPQAVAKVVPPKVVSPLGFASYNFRFVGAVLEGPSNLGGTYKFKTKQFTSQIG